MSDSVQVCCRFRPVNDREKRVNSEPIIDVADTKTVYLDTSRTERNHGKMVFSFDHVFRPDTTQEEVYFHTAKKLGDEVMRGFNCTVLAYGQTGSGKTHTMMGEPKSKELRGIIPRLGESIFDHIESFEEDTEFRVKISFVEIYRERIRDLLDPSKSNLKIREGTRGLWIQDVTECYVSSIEDIYGYLNLGNEHRMVASHNMNADSSRSHAVFTITIGQQNKVTGSKKGGKLTLVDLAGSETVGKTGATGSVLDEAKSINKSLSELGNVVAHITEGRAHVPYRNSTLTRLLSDSLGGNSKTCLIVTCSPVADNAEETLSTLRFGTRAKKIKNKPVVNQERSVAEYKLLLQQAAQKCDQQAALIARLQSQNKRLKELLNKAGSATPADMEDLQAEIDRVSQMKFRNKSAALSPRSPASNRRATAENMSRTPQRDSSDQRLSLTGMPLVDVTTNGSSSSSRTRSDSTSSTTSNANISTLELERELEALQSQINEKDDTIGDLSESLADRERELEELQDELAARDEKITKQQEEIFSMVQKQEQEASVEAEHEAKLRKQLLELESYKRRADILESEQKMYLSQIDTLQSENLQLINLQKDVTSPTQTGRKQARSGSLGASGGKSSSSSAGGGKGGDVEPVSPISDVDDEEKERRMSQIEVNYNVLMGALGRKCEQYIKLQLDMSKVAEKLAEAEEKLRKVEADKGQEKEEKIAELQKRLVASDELCQKLFHSGLYWQKRAQRKDKELHEARRSGPALHKRGPSTAHITYEQYHQQQLEREDTVNRGVVSENQTRGTRTRTLANVDVPVTIKGGKKATGKPLPNLARQSSFDHFF